MFKCNSFFGIHTFNFDDCYEVKVHEIVALGLKCHWVGWLPNMEFRYVDSDGDVIYDNCFPEWDH